MSNSSRDFKPLPVVLTSICDMHLKIPAVRKTVERVVLQVVDYDRGTFIFDKFADNFIFHLPLNQLDKECVGPFLDTALDVWVVAKARVKDIKTPDEIKEGAFD